MIYFKNNMKRSFFFSFFFFQRGCLSRFAQNNSYELRKENQKKFSYGPNMVVTENQILEKKLSEFMLLRN